MPAKKAARKGSKRAMSKAHKRALAEGRTHSRVVRDYLQALDAGSQRRGRLPTLTPSDVQARIDVESDPLRRVELIQQRMDVEDRLAVQANEPDVESLERQFVQAAKGYAQRKGISYTAFRELGVPAAVLREAGVPRTRRSG